MISILFVTCALGYGIGGSEKALIELLQRIDFCKYNVTVLSLNEQPQIPYKRDGIKIIYGCNGYLKISSPLRVAVKHIKDYSIRQILMKIRVALCSRIPGLGVSCEKMWDMYSKYISTESFEYDVVIGYGPGMATFYAIDKVKAKHKILWVDTDLAKAHFNLKYFRKYYNYADKIVFVDKSGICRFSEIYPELNDKLAVIRNIVPVDEIKSKSFDGVGFQDDYDGIRILSVGRLCEAKAFHIAINAAHIIKSKGISFRWYIIGWGTLEKRLREQIVEYNLEKDVILLGQKLNPYPFFSQSHIYVQTSVYEGSPVTIEEAMIFGLPIVSTNIPSIYEIIENGKNGFICEMSANSIADAVERLISDESLRNSFSQCLQKHPLDYEKPIKDFDGLLIDLSNKNTNN